MAENQGPDGWEAEDHDREKIRELREAGFDPGSAQQKLKAMGQPSARNLGTDERSGDVEQPVSGAASGTPQMPGGEGHQMVERDDATGGEDRAGEDPATNSE